MHPVSLTPCFSKGTSSLRSDRPLPFRRGEGSNRSIQSSPSCNRHLNPNLLPMIPIFHYSNIPRLFYLRPSAPICGCFLSALRSLCCGSSVKSESFGVMISAFSTLRSLCPLRLRISDPFFSSASFPSLTFVKNSCHPSVKSELSAVMFSVLSTLRSLCPLRLKFSDPDPFQSSVFRFRFPDFPPSAIHQSPFTKNTYDRRTTTQRTPKHHH
jgi:hypothetical protein